MSEKRYPLLDVIRGLTMISMILYHAMWDLVYMRGLSSPWYAGRPGYLWQQSICWTFIFLSGFCIIFSKRLLKRGLTVFGGGLLVTLVTIVFLYEDRVVFGVLTLIGSCMLLMIPLRKVFEAGRPGKILPAGFLISLLIFILTKDINSHRIGLSMLHRICPLIPDLFLAVPNSLYRNLATAYIGFPPASFYSTDYFSLMPWFFLYLCGYFTGSAARLKGWLENSVFQIDIPPLSWIGRHSLIIYLLHQVVLYLILIVIPGLM